VRILIATSYLGIIGGIETYLQAIIPLLQKHGHDVRVACEHLQHGSEGSIIDYADGKPTIYFIGADITKLFGDWIPEVVFSNGLQSTEQEEKLVASFPTVGFIHDSAGNCISGTRLTRFPFPQICERRFGPACLFNYFPLRCGGASPISGIKRYVQARKRSAILEKMHAIVVASEWMKNTIQNSVSACSKLYVNPYFIRAQALSNIAQPREKKYSYKVLFCGRIVRQKGWAEACHSLVMARKTTGINFKLEVVGDGPDLHRMRRLAKANNLHIETHGWTNSQTLFSIMGLCDFLLMPVLWAEPFGIVGIESALHGLPTIGYSMGGMGEWLEHGKSGLSCGPNIVNRLTLSENIVRIYQRKEEWQALRVGAWEKARQFTEKKHLEKLNIIFEKTK
jgi:glycosyltransferase involved in cell wall biosynthesis